ncbi:alpha-beta hydrolase superfamily lysophospholipase [Hoeflea marina]|uniref:Alpha-beta hydrolase superfamily lysophospholipase n=1 Tax=Hoeflea marina TaxID=274592 RepID=A0A317PG05_9HYPH|nr:alpha/beta hydrolase [Hoeflea marina]PWV95271.1 alpha-beta hydrolase superfamily lysophospholipase [Hoeflea marina]
MTSFSAAPLPSSTGAILALRHMPAEGPARAVVQINHGLAEHSGRYRRFAAFLAGQGYHVYAHDHRGHGGTRAPDAIPGQFAHAGGTEKVIADVLAVHDHIAARHPGLPVVVFGHSMGGLIALNFAERHPRRPAALAVWNSNFHAGPAGRAAQIILATEAWLKGSDVPSQMLPRLTFAAWGRAIPRHRTPFDWLSHDSAEVDAYIRDPLCGWDATVGMWQAVFRLIYAGASKRALSRLPRALPIHLVGGAEDPSTGRGAALEWLARRMRGNGLADVTLSILPGTRHESLNETNRTETMADFSVWLLGALPAAAAQPPASGT